MSDEYYMRQALKQAGQAAVLGEVPVGALIISQDGEVLARAHNMPIKKHDPTAHAEILAIRQAAAKIGNYRLIGASLYVTLEPCTMCAGAISNARIERLVFGAFDEKGGAVKNGVRFFDQNTCHFRPQIKTGILSDDCSLILKEFFKARRK